ncbi:MAG: molybdopterin converting factor subunit 1 [Anaerolineales bacterium]|nr:molybdopterin converting factor subunit 1 [Anaerolineales bacterium]MDP2975636.1 molybdopterin converting factor subunit 1 [Anaerolineales bacterium]MDP3186461.1 molybdopterin converting factor subunit 1 [Anaerolineales bacterium]
MKKVKVLFFATLRDRAGAKSLEIEIPEGATVQQLKDQISCDHPNLEQSMQSVVVAINREFAFDESILPESAEVAMFPPVSGG